MKRELHGLVERIFFWALCCGVIACSAELKNGVFACEDRSDCPGGWFCDPVGRLCYEDPSLFPRVEDSATDDLPDTAGDTDHPDLSGCERAALDDERIVCCPATLPWGCDRDDWSFSTVPDPRSYGCCLPDRTGVVRCEGEYQRHLEPHSCQESVCGYDSGHNRMECPRGDNNSCTNPHVIDVFPFRWVGYWPHYGQTFAPTNDCGSGGVDIWFAVEAPTGREVIVKETTSSEVVIRQPEGCDSGVCRDWSDNGSLTVKGKTGRVYIVVSEDNVNRSDALSMLFELR